MDDNSYFGSIGSKHPRGLRRMPSFGARDPQRDNFVLKQVWLTCVQKNKQFFGHDNEEPQLKIVFSTRLHFSIEVPELSRVRQKSKIRNSRNKPVVAKVSSSTSTPGISPDVIELKDMVKALLLDKKSQAPTPVKAVEESCVTCGGAHSYRNCPATNGNVYRDNIQEYVSQAAAANYNQGNTGYRAPIANQIHLPVSSPFKNNPKQSRN
ncbi:hypothetical protein Tco_0684649 [Tanacetum coccineum]